MCVCLPLCVCLGKGLHNPKLEESSSFKKLHIPYSQASYSQTDDESNMKTDDEGKRCTHPHKGEDSSLAATSSKKETTTINSRS